ncbi:MAG: hypothetical protein DRP89_08355 [Candidatus Neomarinimicrobiota bacterium]|nr:MAG: hypothetical protein DRP89_08355 [Candidatus Neomarinimicrobiota bacterium]
MKNIKYLWVIFGFLALGVNSYAGGTKTAKSDSIRVKYHFNPVVVTATKIAGAQRDLAASVTLINSAMIQRTPAYSVLEAVKTYVPDLYVTEWGVMGYGVAGNSAGKISIRGLGGGATTYVLILRNGRPDFMGLMGCTVPDEFMLEGVEKIEVLRGPASFLYGTNAMGGVINIISKKMTKNGFKTELTGGIGDFNSKKLSVTHGGKRGRVEYYLTATTRKTDGHRDYSNYESDYYTAHIGIQLARNTKMEMNGDLANINLFDPGPESTPFVDHWYDLRRYGGSTTIIHKSSIGESYLKLYSTFGRHKIYDGWYSKDRTLGLMFYQNTKPWVGNTTTIGFDLERYGGNAKNVKSDSDFGKYYITEYAPYIHTQQLLLGRFIASAGFRLEHHELFGYETVPKIGLVAHAAKTTSLRLSVAKGFRSPSIRELYFWRPKNPDLKPERLWNYEVGLTQQLGSRFKFESTFFKAKGNNLIRMAGTWPDVKWKNSGKFTHTGYELVLDWLPFDYLEFYTSWSKLDLGNETLNAPGKKLSVYVSYQFRFIQLSGNLSHIRDLYGADFRQNPMNNYTLLNLTLQLRILKSISLRIKARNVLNSRYQSMYGYPMPGRNFFVDMKYAL